MTKRKAKKENIQKLLNYLEKKENEVFDKKSGNKPTENTGK